MVNALEILGLDGEDVDAMTLRRAYLAGVKRHPPDRDPDGFRRVRDAYDLLRDEDRRAEIRLFGTPGLNSLSDLARELTQRRHRVGLEPWLKVLRTPGS